MATNSTSANVLSEEWFQQVNGLLDTVEVAGQTIQTPQHAPSQISTGMTFLRPALESLFYTKFFKSKIH